MDIDWSFMWDHKKPNLEQQFQDWYYGPWSEEKYNEFSKLDAIGPIHDYMLYLSNLQSDKEYMARYGLSYSDIHNPYKLRASSSPIMRSAYSYVSRNVSRLYR